MLRIEKVFIQGFKSFCDPTEVVFDPEGITAVVGPNGCGKSNVADALNWVIGEQRAKALRGGKMEDVIFQGSRNRKPSGMAEVMLTLRVYEKFEIRLADKADNSDIQPTNEGNPGTGISEEKPTEVSKSTARTYVEGEKISIARRLYRTGESEYEMNGRTCRLRDIQDLFAGTGLGASHYAIIEQGRIGQVLSAKPFDRRALIEEAAGISKFKMRQRAAELKLEAARQNLARVTDIIAEVERQQTALKRQAAKARRFQRLKTEMRDLLKYVLVNEYLQTQKQISELDERKFQISQEEEKLGRQINDVEQNRQIKTTVLEDHSTALTELRAIAAETNLQIEKTRQQQSYLQAQLTSLSQRTERSSSDQSALIERGQLLTQENIRLKEQLAIIETEINFEASRLQQFENEHTEKSKQDHQIEEQLVAVQRQVTETATTRERWKQLVRQFSESLDRVNKSLSGLEAEQQRTSVQQEKLNEEYQVIADQVHQKEEEDDQIKSALATCRKALSHKEKEYITYNSRLSDIQKQMLATEQRLKSLLELDESRSYFSETVQAVIEESRKSKNISIIGTLADFIRVRPEDEVMIEVALKEELQYIITPTFEDALNAIAFLKREQRGRATFLVLDTRPETDKGAYQPGSTAGNGQIIHLVDLLGLKPEIKSVIRQALPRLAQTVIAEQIQQAIQASISTNGKGNSFLTATGEFISAGHIIAGGSHSTKGRGILGLKREIEILKKQRNSLHQEVELQELLCESCKSDIADLSEQFQLLDTHQREIEKGLFQQRGFRSQIEKDIERVKTHLRVIEAELYQAKQEEEQIKEKLDNAETKLLKAENSFKSVELNARETSEVLFNIRQQSTHRIQELSSRRADFAAKSERRKGLQQDIRRLENEVEELKKRSSRLQIEASEAEVQAQSFQDSLQDLGESLSTFIQQHEEQIKQINFAQAQWGQEKEIISRLENTAVSLRETLSDLREQRSEIDILRTKFQMSMEHLAENCFAELGEKIQELIVQRESLETGLVTLLIDNDQISRDNTIELDSLDTDQVESATVSLLPTEEIDLESGKKRLEELREKIDGIGPVNLLALEEISQQEERLIFLLEQKADIENAVSDTLSVITELKKRSKERFLDAFTQINRNFTEMFLELFGGGHGEMRLIDETDVLESGIDLIAQPPGKRLQNVLLLSGGEKAMAALALVMGIFKYRPSPFCLLDEVDAPLDDVNIGRFADKVLEMSKQTQFMVITHSKRTMEAAKTLYGVTMEDPGVSKLISVRLT